MSLRLRYAGVISMVYLVTLAAALFVAGVQINASQERQFDDALRREAFQEAHEIANAGGDRLRISPRLGPSPDDVGPLTKYAALYDPDGRVIDATPSWEGEPPARIDLPRPIGNMGHADLRLRGLALEVSGHPGTMLLLAAPRSDLDADARNLRRTMGVVFSVAILATVLLTSALVGRITAVHQRIAHVARRVADEDLDARVGSVRGAPEVVQLARDVDAMVERIASLLRTQGDFIAHAAHELRSPLTALYGELSYTALRQRSPEQTQLALEASLDAARRLIVLADDLLVLARAERAPGEFNRVVPVSELVEETVAAVADEARSRSVELHVDVFDSEVLGRSMDLSRMLRNVVENAVAHAPDGTAVVLRAREQDDLVLLSVRDYGPGVDPGDAERIFQPFFRGRRERASERAGTGLGLAIAAEIARSHPSGRIDLEPVDGPGACFVIRLASARAAREQGTGVRRGSPAPPRPAR